MNRGVMIKMTHEVWQTTAVFALALGAIEALLAYLLPSVLSSTAPGGSDQWLQVKFIRDILKGLLGTEISGMIGPRMLTSVPWVHPIVLTLLWAHEITLCTRMPAGEVDRGTIDVLLGLPVSRTGVYLSVSVVWLGSGMVVVIMALIGNLIGSRLAAPEFRTALGPMMIVTVNMFCLYFAVGGMSFLISTLSDRRGRAVGMILAILLISFLLSFLAQFWGLAKAVSFLSIMQYYRPLLIFQDASWPVTDMLVLTGVGGAVWLMGALVFARRDMRTV